MLTSSDVEVAALEGVVQMFYVKFESTGIITYENNSESLNWELKITTKQ